MLIEAQGCHGEFMGLKQTHSPKRVHAYLQMHGAVGVHVKPP